jgi:hypothetical protein
MKYKIVALFFLQINFAFADVVIEHDKIIIKNHIQINEHIIFKKAFQKNAVKKIHFENCFGGDISTSYLISEVISENKLDTVASGVIASACVYSFIAGVSREYYDLSDKGTIFVMHGVKSTTNDVVMEEKLNKLLRKYIKYKLPNFTDKYLDLVFSTNKNNEGLQLVITKNNSLVNKIEMCNNKWYLILQDCHAITSDTPMSLGIINKFQ